MSKKPPYSEKERATGSNGYWRKLLCGYCRKEIMRYWFDGYTNCGRKEYHSECFKLQEMKARTTGLIIIG